MDVTSEVKFYLNSASSDTFGLYVDTLPVPTMGQMRFSQWSVGADEDRAQPDWTFEDIEYTITAYRFLPETLDDTDLHLFFQNPQTLQLSTLPGVYFKIRTVSVNTSGDYDNRRIRYDITFTLAPFRYKTDNAEILLDDQSGTLVKCDGNRYCKPVFRIIARAQTLIGGETIVITVNGQEFSLHIPDAATTYIDSDREIVYSNGYLLRDNALGKYPLLSPGDNVISWTGSPSAVYLTKNERWY